MRLRFASTMLSRRRTPKPWSFQRDVLCITTASGYCQAKPWKSMALAGTSITCTMPSIWSAPTTGIGIKQYGGPATLSFLPKDGTGSFDLTLADDCTNFVLREERMEERSLLHLSLGASRVGRRPRHRVYQWPRLAVYGMLRTLLAAIRILHLFVFRHNLSANFHLAAGGVGVISLVLAHQYLDPETHLGRTRFEAASLTNIGLLAPGVSIAEWKIPIVRGR